MNFVAYSTPKYKEKFGDFLPKDNTTLTVSETELDYVECIRRKVQNLIEYTPPPENEDCKYVASIDLDIVFFKNPTHWRRFVEYMDSSPAKVFFMRDAVQKNVNSGLYFVKREYFESPHFKEFLSRTTYDPPHYEQTYVNIHRDELEWEFIPDEFSYVPTRPFGTDMSKVLFYHAICVEDKLESMRLAQQTKRYQLYLCYHEGVFDDVLTILCEHPWLIPHRLNSTKYYESEFLLKNMNPDPECEFTGLVTYSIIKKPQCYPNLNILAKVLDEHGKDFDAITLNHCPDHKFEETNTFHPKFMNIWNRLLDKLLGISSATDCRNMELFYNNYWLARPGVMLEYQKFLRRAAEILEEDPDVYDDACYITPKLSPERLVEISGKPHYTYHPFVLERIPCLFFHIHKQQYKVAHLMLSPC